MPKLFKTYRALSIGLLLLTGMNALIAGFLFIIEPSGAKMGMSLSSLSGSPFSNYAIPGIILFVLNGWMNMIVAVLILKNYKFFPVLVSIQGLLLSGWIIIQAMMLKDFNGLHFTMLIIGITLLIVGLFLRSKGRNRLPPIVFVQNQIPAD